MGLSGDSKKKGKGKRGNAVLEAFTMMKSDDGWDDDDFGTSSNSAAITTMNKDDDDDFFASFDSKPATRPVGRLSVPKKTGLSLTSKAAPGLKVKKPIKPAVKKLSPDLMDDGWDDF